MRKSLYLLVVLCFITSANAQTKAVKNVIVMIPDGTSIPVVSLSRWYQWYVKGGDECLAIDPHICALVKTHSSDAPIGDSAPTTSTYMTGYLSKSGYVSTYPSSGKNDIYPIDSSRNLQPLTTVAEAVRIINGKSIGLVATCEFPHATPADVTAHCYSRNNYGVISSQMAHNGIDFLAAGGTSLLKTSDAEYLNNKGVTVVKDNITEFRNYKGNKMWALFGQSAQPYDIDRDTATVPSIKEMTLKAIDVLSQNKNGFFLMVEGSKVDWAAHMNDPVGMVTEYLAFDRAVGAALEFAKKDGETLVLILPDHGNGGISIGTRSVKAYDKMPLSQLMDPFKEFKVTANGMSQILNSKPNSEAKSLFKTLLGIELSGNELELINNSSTYSNSPINERKGKSLPNQIAEIITSRTPIGFTTGGHTGEDVFLAAYNPYGDKPTGLLTGVEINQYICRQLGLEGKLDSLTQDNFAKHNEVFKDFKINITNDKLTVKNGKKTLSVYGNTNIVNIDGKEILLNSVVVYVDKNNTFYLPKSIREYLN